MKIWYKTEAEPNLASCLSGPGRTQCGQGLIGVVSLHKPRICSAKGSKILPGVDLANPLIKNMAFNLDLLPDPILSPYSGQKNGSLRLSYWLSVAQHLAGPGWLLPPIVLHAKKSVTL